MREPVLVTRREAVATVTLNRPEARFALSEARLDLTPATISPYVVRAIGKRAAHRLNKVLVGSEARGPIDDAMIDTTARAIAQVRVTPEGRDGIASFMNKRAPGWAIRQTSQGAA